MSTFGPAFDFCLEAGLEEEGGFVDNPNDPGGVTNMGITIRLAGTIHLDLDHDGDTDANDIRAITKADAALVYYTSFYKPQSCDLMPLPIAYLVFDTSINMGMSAGAKFLQRVLGVADDGQIGPATIKALADRSNDVGNLIWAYSAQRTKRYSDLILNNALDRAQGKTKKDFSAFAKGWYNRSHRAQWRALTA